MPTLVPPLSLPLFLQACWASRMTGISSPWSSTMGTQGGSPFLTSASCLPTTRFSVRIRFRGTYTLAGPTHRLVPCSPPTPVQGSVCHLDHLHPQGMEMAGTVGGAPRTGSEEGTTGYPSFRDLRLRLQEAGCTCWQRCVLAYLEMPSPLTSPYELRF